jgi:hypothetical protein
VGPGEGWLVHSNGVLQILSDPFHNLLKLKEVPGAHGRLAGPIHNQPKPRRCPANAYWSIHNLLGVQTKTGSGLDGPFQNVAKT